MIVLSKGQKIDLGKDLPTLKNVMAMLSWVPKPNQQSGAEFDLDVTMLLLGENDTPFLDELDSDTNCNSLIYYGNLTGAQGAIIHSGDDPNGAEGEQILCKLDQVDQKYKKIIVLVTIDKAEQRTQNFGMVEGAKVVLKNEATGVQELEYDLNFDASVDTGVQFCSFIRKGTGWGFSADSMGFPDGLKGFLNRYGIQAG